MSRRSLYSQNPFVAKKLERARCMDCGKKFKLGDLIHRQGRNPLQRRYFHEGCWQRNHIYDNSDETETDEEIKNFFEEEENNG